MRCAGGSARRPDTPGSGGAEGWRGPAIRASRVGPPTLHGGDETGVDASKDGLRDAPEWHLAAIVVTFHPSPSERHRVLEHAAFIDRVIVVDNSVPAAFAAGELDAVGNVELISLDENRGVAHALNVGVRRAAALGYRIALLLDQDTVVSADAVREAIACADPRHGITAIGDRRASVDDRPTDGARVREVTMAVTSGSVLSIAAFHRCGDFEEKMFIDYVDHDYCLRLKDLGFPVVKCLSAAVAQSLGEARRLTLFGRSFRYASHRPFRLYYITRNGLHFAAKHAARHPLAALQVFAVLSKELVKALLVETDRSARLRYMASGLRDWLRGRYGKLELGE